MKRQTTWELTHEAWMNHWDEIRKSKNRKKKTKKRKS
jgi:hypothetical protein